MDTRDKGLTLKEDFFSYKILIILFVGTLIYLPSLYFNFFIIDDKFHIFIGNVRERGWIALLYTWGESSTPIISNIWQLITLSFFQNRDPQPEFYRFFNISFHIINSLLFYYLCKKLLAKKEIPNSSTAILFAALIFLVHPIQVENVVWISGLKDILAFLFILLSFIAFTQLNTRTVFTKIAIGIILYLCAILTKPTTALFIFIAPLLMTLQDVSKKTLKILAITALLIITTLYAIYYHFTSSMLNPFLLDISLAQRFYTFFHSLNHYLSSHFFPTSLSPLYDYNFIKMGQLTAQASSVQWIITALPFFILLAILSLCLTFYRNNHTYIILSIGVTIYLLGFTPTSGIIPFDYNIVSTVSDRYAYYSTAGLALFFLFIALQWKKSSKYILPIYLLILSILSIYQVSKWKENTLILSSSPLETRQHQMYYAFALIREGHFREGFNITQKLVNQSSGSRDSHELMLHLLNNYRQYYPDGRLENLFRSQGDHFTIEDYPRIIDGLLAINAHYAASEYIRRMHELEKDNITIVSIDEQMSRRWHNTKRDYLIILTRLAHLYGNREERNSYLEILKNDYPGDPLIQSMIREYK